MVTLNPMTDYVKLLRDATDELTEAEDRVNDKRAKRRELLKAALESGVTATSLEEPTGMSRQAIKKDVAR